MKKTAIGMFLCLSMTSSMVFAQESSNQAQDKPTKEQTCQSVKGTASEIMKLRQEKEDMESVLKTTDNMSHNIAKNNNMDKTSEEAFSTYLQSMVQSAYEEDKVEKESDIIAVTEDFSDSYYESCIESL